MTDSKPKQLRLLSIEDDVVASELLEAQLATSFLDCRIEHASTMSQALELLATRPFDVVLLDLMLPDSHGLDGLELLRMEVEVPIVVVTADADEEKALAALSKGAQDYLFKGEISTHTVIRSIRYAVERHRLTDSLRELSLIDELTGLYNRRGFSTLASQQLKVAERMKSGAVLVLADIDDLKIINDSCGHIEGDRAIEFVAQTLVRAFRASDVVARWGGDEFVVLGLSSDPESITELARRAELGIAEHGSLKHPVRMSWGMHFEPAPKQNSLEAMLASADAALYCSKADRKREASRR